MTALSQHRNYLQDVLARQVRRRLTVDAASASIDAAHTSARVWDPQPVIAGPSRARHEDEDKGDAGAGGSAGTPSKMRVANYVPEEETVRNDYTAWYGASGEWGSNFVLGAEPERVCEE